MHSSTFYVSSTQMSMERRRSCSRWPKSKVLVDGTPMLSSRRYFDTKFGQWLIWSGGCGSQQAVSYQYCFFRWLCVVLANLRRKSLNASSPLSRTQLNIKFLSGFSIDSGTLLMEKILSFLLMLLTINSERIWRGWRKSVLTEVWDILSYESRYVSCLR